MVSERAWRKAYSSIVRCRSFDLIGEILDLHFKLGLNVFELDAANVNHRWTRGERNLRDFDQPYLPGSTRKGTCTSTCSVPAEQSFTEAADRRTESYFSQGICCLFEVLPVDVGPVLCIDILIDLFE